MSEPGFLIIGAQRCGTSYLSRLLKHHPLLKPANTKELHFFDCRYDNGIDWYEELFPDVSPPRMCYEASPCYLFWPFCAKRIYHYQPSLKFIVLLRDPVERAWSHYCHEVRIGAERLSFVDALERERIRTGEWSEKTEYNFETDHFGYASRGRYEQQLQRWLNYFPLSQMLILKSESLFQSPVENLNRIVDFLDIDAFDWSGVPLHTPKTNGSAIDDAISRRLEQDFAFYNRKLAALLGSEFTWNSQVR